MEHSDDDVASATDWAEQVGDVIDEEDVAQLLRWPLEDVRQTPALLRLHDPSGRVVYPLMQFDGRQPVPGVEEAIAILLPAAGTPVTVAAWLTMRNNALGGHRPIDELRSGDLAVVLALAEQAAERMRR